ncbi:MAG: type II toxin-antitoxin system VapB family antitoxin [Candidatus Accumulibacter sp.]|uniref:Type II toxin-antitoxin system VapB family antitoxin n=1 Tax=Candidatus Accumulibacter proximus TaxID=2954385 RepID=A0A935UHF8_9PROT|nr:type II toxin-antitoxin system VapB family antitoxin [Candidatus Accumulibacter proximus]
MRTTLALDDVLIAKARVLPAICEEFALVREALKALVERESARRLGLLGGSAFLLPLAPHFRRQLVGIVALPWGVPSSLDSACKRCA